MASSFGSCIIMIIIIIATISIPTRASNQYIVGDTKGWRLPDEKNAELYKIRASKCSSTRMILLLKWIKEATTVATRPVGLMFKDGNTVFLLDKSGFYCFVSGDFDHCRKGQRLMIEVKGQQLPPSMAGPSPSPLPSAAVSWIIPSFRTLVALEAFMIMACCPLYGPCLA